MGCSCAVKSVMKSMRAIDSTSLPIPAARWSASTSRQREWCLEYRGRAPQYRTCSNYWEPILPICSNTRRRKPDVVAVPLLRPAGQMVILIKPQFEVGKGQVGKGGIVREPQLHQAACERVTQADRKSGFQTAIIESPIAGAEGNKEFLLYARH